MDILQKNNGIKYLVFAFTDKNKEVLKKYTELLDEIKDAIEKMNDIPGKYGKYFIKIKLNSDDNLPLNKVLKIHNLTINNCGQIYL